MRDVLAERWDSDKVVGLNREAGESSEIASVEELVEEISQGRMVILVDDEDRENEGDLVMAAEYASAESIAFMATQGCGLICLALTGEMAAQMDLPLMPRRNVEEFSTNFTLSIEASSGISSGISAHDRARTVASAIAPDVTPEDVVTPGHVFPIVARSGGVLERHGHTEASVELARLAGLRPAAVICEVMKADGTMARMDSLEVFARYFNLKIGRICDLVRYCQGLDFPG